MQRLQTLLGWLEITPHDPFIHFGIAMEYISMDDHEKALQKMEFILEGFPDYLANYYQLAKQYEIAEAKEKAIEVYEKGISLALKQNETKTANELRSALEELIF